MRDTAYNKLSRPEGPRAPVQLDTARTIPYEISAEAWKEYAAQGFGSQSHDRILDRGGFGYLEVMALLYDRIKRLESERGETRHA